MNRDPENEARLRIDKWLWAARFFKTRTLATAAVDGGRVHLNQSRVKPAHAIDVGDTVDITLGARHITVTVCALSATRGPAPQARTLYAETAESIERAEFMKQNLAGRQHGARPTKQDRRRINRIRGFND
ncbi:MAG: RNA-binding S4 domain-containing protein [Rhodocyclaceae bacterium]|nr:RNA-binding S4 domain-containing protein [Rhodocyclaceae bacterium]